LLLSTAAILAPLLCWQLGVALGVVNTLFFPAPGAIAAHLFELFTRDLSFWSHIGQSLLRLGLGALIAVPLAIVLAFGIELNSFVGVFFRPWIGLLFPLPKLALFPFFMLIFGMGNASKVAMIGTGIFFFVLLGTLQGVRRLRDEGYMDLAQVFQIPRGTTLYRVVFLGSLPEILAGLKMGLGYGLVMVVASEFSVAQSGIGVFIWNAWEQFRILDLYAGLTVISLLGYFIFALIEVLGPSDRHRKAY
jgi:ABC-type nitrate/sulfonate/bicarbonate transport system permease component